MVTKRQVRKLKNKLSYLGPTRLYIFDEINDKILDSQGESVSDKELEELSNKENAIIIIDDIQPED